MFHATQGEKGKVIAYGKAITNINAYGKQITDEKQADDIPFVGDKIKLKIKELLQTGKLRKTEALRSDPKLSAIQLFADIHGIGPFLGKKLYEGGMRTIEDLVKNQKKVLTPIQQIGLKYLEDFKQKIPRQEASQIEEVVQKAAYSLFKEGDRILEVLAVGSYRRGKSECGDVDVLICRKDDKPIKGFLE